MVFSIDVALGQYRPVEALVRSIKYQRRALTWFLCSANFPQSSLGDL